MGGILQVTAQDKGTQKKHSITITNDNNRLTPEEIQKMIDEAEQFAEDDKLVKEHTEAKNELEQYAFSLKRQVDELKIQDDDKKALEEVAQPIIAKMYQQGQGQDEQREGEDR